MPVTQNGFISPQAVQSAYAKTTTATAAAPYTDTPTNTSLLLTAGANGSRVTRLRSIPRNTITATVMLLFASTDSGTTKLLIDSKALPADTVSATDPPAPVDWGYSDDNPLYLKAGVQLYVAQTVTLTDAIVTEAEWGDY